MKSRIVILVTLALLAGVGVVIGLKVASKKKSLAAVAAQGKLKEAEAAKKAPPVLVYPQPGPTTEDVHISGTLRPDAEVDLAFKLPGRVAEVNVKKGDIVHKGDVLARIDERDLEAQAQQVKAGVAAARAQSAMATDALRRSKNLVSAGAASEQQLVMAGGQANLTAASIQQVEAQGRVVDLLKQEAKLVAPIDGVVVRAPNSPGFFTSPGTPFFRIERLTTLKFAANIADRDASRLKAGMALDIVTETGAKVRGVIDLLIPSADPATRRVPIEASVPNPDGTLIAGSLVDASVQVAAPANVSIPTTALLTGDTSSVLVVNGNKLERRVIKLLRTQGDRLLVLSGLALTDKVVANPGTSFADGDEVAADVEVQGSPAPAPAAAEPAPATPADAAPAASPTAAP